MRTLEALHAVCANYFFILWSPGTTEEFDGVSNKLPFTELHLGRIVVPAYDLR